MRKSSLSAIEEAEEYWHAGRTAQAGSLIYDAVPAANRPRWAARILRLRLDRSGADPSDFENVLKIADDPAQWGSGRRAFHDLCAAGSRYEKTYDRRTLTTERLVEVQQYNGLLGLAEVVAQITYNASDPPDPFDRNLGGSVLSFLMSSAQRWNEKDYWAKAWAALSWIGDQPEPADERDYRIQAEEAWQRGNALKAGRLIFENLPSDERPGWAARILRLVLDRSGIDRPKDRAGWFVRMLRLDRGPGSVDPSTFQQVLDTAEKPELWANGHRVFDRLRREVLVMDNIGRTRRLSGDEKLLAAVLMLAELVAKVSYNATDPDDAFDHDSGWWIARCLKHVLDLLNDNAISEAAWSALCRKET